MTFCKLHLERGGSSPLVRTTEQTATMKIPGTLFLASLLAAPLTQAAAPLDPTRRAEANDKVFATDTLNQQTLSFPRRDFSDVPVTGGTVESKTLERRTLDSKTVESRSLSQPLLERGNVETKRAGANDKTADRSTTVPPAPVVTPARQIDANNEQELKEQLRKLP